ncbi:MAG: hypothetical protein ABIH72_05995 [archaeon]
MPMINGIQDGKDCRVIFESESLVKVLREAEELGYEPCGIFQIVARGNNGCVALRRTDGQEAESYRIIHYVKDKQLTFGLESYVNERVGFWMGGGSGDDDF